jgi:hypothetical protein
MATITEKYLEALKQSNDWITVSDWAIKVGEVYPDLLAKAESEAKNQANDTTGLREIAARISSAIIRGAYQNQIEIDAAERPRKVRYISLSEHDAHVQDDIEDDVEPLKRNEIIGRDSAQLSAHDLYRITEFENISKQLKHFFGLEFEVDHAKALLNPDAPGNHHPDNLQLLLKAHNGKKHNQNWVRFTKDEQVDYILAAINIQKIIATRFLIDCDESVLESLLSRLTSVY